MKNLTVYVLLSIIFLGHHSLAQNFGYETMDRPWSAELGIGPGWMYADNVGSIRRIGFSVSPAASFALTKNINAPLSIRGTLGFQGLRGNMDTDINRRLELGEDGNAYDFRGNAYYLDIAPVFRLFRSRDLVYRRKFNIYGSAGLGAMGIVSTYDIIEDDASVTRENNLFIPYIPVRAGISYRFRPLWDFALEGSLMVTFTDDIDGNRGNNKFNDYPMNMQIKVRKFFTFKMVNPLLGNPTY